MYTDLKYSTNCHLILIYSPHVQFNAFNIIEGNSITV